MSIFFSRLLRQSPADPRSQFAAVWCVCNSPSQLSGFLPLLCAPSKLEHGFVQGGYCRVPAGMRVCGTWLCWCKLSGAGPGSVTLVQPCGVTRSLRPRLPPLLSVVLLTSTTSSSTFVCLGRTALSCFRGLTVGLCAFRPACRGCLQQLLQPPSSEHFVGL